MSDFLENVLKVLRSKELLGVLAIVFVGSQLWSAMSSHRGAELQNESYISSLQASYQGDLRECIQLTNSTSQQQPAEGEEAPVVDTAAITSQCIASVNDQRVAQILRDRGYGDLLEQTQ